jgi:glyoxylase I family protein
MAAIEVLGIEHVDLTVNELARSEAYYAKVLGALGFRRIDDDDPRWVNAHFSIAMRPAAPTHLGVKFDRYRTGLHHLAFKAKSRSDVDEFHRFLVSEGLPVLDGPAEYPQYGEHYYATFFADPDGIKLELAHFPWGYWRRVQTDGRDDRARYASK